MFEQVDALALLALVAWGLLGWAVLPRLTERRILKNLRRGAYDDILGGLVDYALQRAGETLKGKIAGVASGAARLEKGLEGAMTLDLIRLQDPVLAEAINGLPEVRRYITKHPEVAQLGLAYIQQKFPQLAQITQSLAGTQQQLLAGAPPTNGNTPTLTNQRW